MNVAHLGDYLSSLHQSGGGAYSILVDGHWGCGKTYQINRFLEKQSDVDTFYVSLFGIDSYEILLMKLAEKLDSKDIVTISGHHLLKDRSSQKDFNGTMIIFDDLDRRGDKLSLKVIFGVFDCLSRLGFRIVAVCSNLGEPSGQEKESISSFTDKVFDYVVSVEANFEDKEAILKTTAPFLSKSDFELASQNWRFLLKVDRFYEHVINAMEEKKEFLREIHMEEPQFFAHLLLACKCSFSSNGEKPSFAGLNETDKNLKELLYQENVQKLGSHATNELYRLFKKNDRGLNKDLVIRLIQCFSQNNPQILLEYRMPEKKDSILREQPFDTEPFFLDDNGKTDYFNAFFERLNEFDFSRKPQLRILREIFGDYYEVLTNEHISKIAKRIAETSDYRDFGDFLFDAGLFNNSNAEKIKLLKKCFEEERALSCRTKLAAKIGEYAAKEDYFGLESLIREGKDLGQSEVILSILLERNFYFPDLSGDVSNSWWYCLAVADLASQSDEAKLALIQVLKDQCRGSKSKSLRSRCNILSKRLSEEDIDFDTIKPTAQKL